MAKIKLNLPTGGTEEKLLLTAFKAENNSYIVFDAENVGSMGLPIILVCKYENDRVVKITDAEEWTKVKGYLKDIISGGHKEYINLTPSLNVDEIYYTQLTLPVASFDTLKASYAPVQEIVNSEVNATGNDILNLNEESLNDQPLIQNTHDNSASAITENNVNPTINNDSPAIANPILGESPTLNVDAPMVDSVNTTDIVDDVIGNEPQQAGLSEQLITPVDPVMSVNPLEQSVPNENIVENSGTENVMPTLEGLNEMEPVNMQVVNTPVSSVDVEDSKQVDYSAEKEDFLAACSKIFDELIAKIEKK